MDRRQRKTRQAIFDTFSELLSRKDFNQITVSEIIAGADVGRATFYAHFETKDFLLKELCEELFCHLFDSEHNDRQHHHIFDCDSSESVFLHLLRHLQNNDHNILLLLSSQNNDLFLRYFKDNLDHLIESHLPLFEGRKKPEVPDLFWRNYISSTFVETLKWWIRNGMKESPEVITEYFFTVI